MATVNISKINNYIPGQDVEDLFDNITLDRLGVDKSAITVNYSVSPAQVTIKKGSIIEHEGDTYVENADNTFAMVNATHNYITFNGSTYSSAATIGAFDITKQGFYSGSNRTLKYYIDQTNKSDFVLVDILYPDLTLFSKQMDRIKVGIDSNTAFTGSPGATVPLDTVYTDSLSSWDTVNYNFTVPESGYYYMSIHASIESASSATLGVLCSIYKNSVSVMDGIWNKTGGVYNEDAFSIGGLFYLEKGDIIEVHAIGDPSIFMVANEKDFYFLVARFL